MKRLPGIASLIPDYDVFIVDQFGTLHDGQTAYPGAIAALRLLREAGRRVALLSNSGKRAEPNAQRLERLGISRDSYAVSMTSGEVAWRLLRAGRIDIARGARTCLLLERGGDSTTLEGIGLTPVPTAADADLVIIAGSEGDTMSLDDYARLLEPAARRGLPCLCTNPDRTMLTPTGPAFGSGPIAEIYQNLGGPVTWIGKPYAEVFETTLAELGDPPRDRAVVIGDSIEHDVAGARGVGASAWLVLTGIIAGATDAALAEECTRFGAVPDGALTAFTP